MARMQWKSKRTLGIAISLIIVYLTIRIRKYEHESSVFLPGVRPTEVWEFVADFSNMKYLNPTITDFTILEESGNYDHWKYSTQYSEYLSHWPHFKNVAIAHFNVKADSERNTYYISSVHKTCLFNGLFCLDSEGEFRFVPSDSPQGTFCEENVIYQCPGLLLSFCKREVVFQRTAIMKNLKNYFANKGH